MYVLFHATRVTISFLGRSVEETPFSSVSRMKNMDTSHSLQALTPLASLGGVLRRQRGLKGRVHVHDDPERLRDFLEKLFPATWTRQGRGCAPSEKPFPQTRTRTFTPFFGPCPTKLARLEKAGTARIHPTKILHVQVLRRKTARGNPTATH